VSAVAQPPLRPEHLIEAIRAYRSLVPAECRIGELQGARHMKDIMITDEIDAEPAAA